ncbi:MAG: uroporphyrinogen-III C-methyltransferase [Candidatus Zixiibacteriota bacterium]
MKKGTVYLIGSGPGDPELISLKGWRLLQTCDVVFYDNLVSDEIVVALPAGQEKHYVGKRDGKHIIPQDEINELLVKSANEGKNVARLKGSDPLVFGRGGEEAKYLRKHGIDFEIIPGITAGVGAPAYVGIPCTDREKASFVIFVTGHKAQDKAVSTVPWEWIAKAENGTIIIYMGVSEIEKIATRLIKFGMSPDISAAVIERGTLPSQRYFSAALKDLPAVVKKNHVRSPSIFVIGEVVDLQPYLSWVKQRPLLGKRVIVTRAPDQARDMYQSLRDLGAEVLPYPSITTCDFHDDKAWSRFASISNSNRWLVFTSENGVRYFMQQLMDKYGDLRCLAGYRIAAVGGATAVAIANWHIRVDFVPKEATATAFAGELISSHDLKGSVLVRVRGGLAGDTVELMATDAGAEVLPITVYDTDICKWPEGFKEKLFVYPPDAAIFTSGSTFRGVLENLTREEAHELFASVPIFSIGPSTTKMIASEGFEVAVESPIHTIPAMIDDLVTYFEKKENPGR